MQRLLARPAILHALPRKCSQSLPTTALGAKISLPALAGPSSGCEWSGKRSFGSERWSPRYIEEIEEPAPVAQVRYNDESPQLVEFWQNDAGALVAQHDELENIESCRWAIGCVCQRIRAESNLTSHQKCLALRFLMDLEEKVEKLSDEGYGTCAIEIFERPWVLTCGDNVEILRLRPRPDSVLKRIAFAALSPVVAPAGALLTYVKSNGANSIAAFKWYLRAVTERPSNVHLDSSYRVEGSSRDFEACASSLTFEDIRRLISVQEDVPQLI